LTSRSFIRSPAPTSAFASKTTGGNAAAAGTGSLAVGDAIGAAGGDGAFSAPAPARGAAAGLLLVARKRALLRRGGSGFSGEGGVIAGDCALFSAVVVDGNTDGATATGTGVDGTVRCGAFVFESRAEAKRHAASPITTTPIAAPATTTRFLATRGFGSATVADAFEMPASTFWCETPSRPSVERESRAVRSGTKRVACFSADRNSAAV